MGFVEVVTVAQLMRNMLANTEKLLGKLAELPPEEDKENAKMLEYIIVPMMAFESIVTRDPIVAMQFLPQTMLIFAKLKEHPVEGMLQKKRAKGDKAAAEAQAAVDALFKAGTVDP